MTVADTHGLEEVFVMLAEHVGAASGSALAQVVQELVPSRGKYYCSSRGDTMYRLCTSTATCEATTTKLRQQGLVDGSGRAWALVSTFLAHKLLNKQ